MNSLSYSLLQIREVFHLEFLRRLSQKLKPANYVLKGGVNLRLNFCSPRYSEDVDLDVSGVTVSRLQDVVMSILQATSFQNALVTFGVHGIGAPDLSKAKQTETGKISSLNSAMRLWTTSPMRIVRDMMMRVGGMIFDLR